MDPAEIDRAALEIAARLHQEPAEVQQAYRYLFARVAEEAGILEPIGHEIRESGERHVYREPASGAFYAVDRPHEWSIADEQTYLAQMKQLLPGLASSSD